MKVARRDKNGITFVFPVIVHRSALCVALGLGMFLLAACGSNNLPRNTQTVDGVTIYLGVIPAELVQGHSTKPGDPQALHGGTPPNRGSHHIVVALFDAKTGARITDATIGAGVGDRSNTHAPDTVLAPMEINGAMSYGNFFLMQSAGEWRIHLEIRRPSVAHAVEADFAYERIADHG